METQMDALVLAQTARTIQNLLSIATGAVPTLAFVTGTVSDPAVVNSTVSDGLAILSGVKLLSRCATRPNDTRGWSQINGGGLLVADLVHHPPPSNTMAPRKSAGLVSVGSGESLGSMDFSLRNHMYDYIMSECWRQ
jgi:hypothetical protein